MLGSFTFILHTHLPYVLRHGKWPHGSDWLSEAVAECYIPLWESLTELSDANLSPKISIDFSPINLEQLADPLFRTVFTDYCDEKILAAEKDRTYFSTNGEAHMEPMADFWQEFYTRSKETFNYEFQGNVVNGFRDLSDKKIIDAMTCGATHGYFPLLLDDSNIRAQIQLAVQTHKNHFGKAPRGIWLPECGYRPSYHWSPSVGPKEFRNQKKERLGVEELVSEAGLEYFVVDGSLTRGGVTLPAYHLLSKPLHDLYEELHGDLDDPVLEVDPNRSLAEIYWVKSTSEKINSNPPAIFSRDAMTAARVWSADVGYPGSAPYLDFHKKHHNSGLRYWAVTGSHVDLHNKILYNRSAIVKQIDHDARDFIHVLKASLLEHRQMNGTAGIIASPFDTELFGHWWFEGPRFIKEVMQLLHDDSDIKLTNCSEALDQYDRPHELIALPEGSWGEGGHHFVWANKQVAWMWDYIYPAEARFAKVIERVFESGAIGASEDDLLKTILDQAARELLLLEASDWEFVISTQGAIDYSTKRFHEHFDLFTSLADAAESLLAGEGLSEEAQEKLEEAAQIDRPFESIDLRLWLPDSSKISASSLTEYSPHAH